MFKNKIKIQKIDIYSFILILVIFALDRVSKTYVIKLIETPKSGINNIPKKKEIMEKIIEDVVDNMMEQICPDKISKPTLNKLYNCISILDNDDIEDLELIEINQ